MANAKFEFTGETKTEGGILLRRIRAVVSFGCVKAGEIGGWIEKEENLSVSGNAWVFGNASVSGNARVYGDASVCGDARVYKRSAIFWISVVGSRDDTITFFAGRGKKINVSVGCFFGTLEQFSKKVTETHGDNEHAKCYMLAVEMAKLRIKMDDMPEECLDD